MAVAFVRSLVSHAQFNGATMALTVPSAGVALGDFLVLCYGVSNNYTNHVTGIADDHAGTTNAWTEAVHFPTAAGVTATTYIWYCPVTTALVSGDIITVTLSGAPGSGEACSISVFSGVNMVAPVDQTQSSGADNTNTYSTGTTGTLATTGELVIACANTSRGNRNVQVASSYTNLHTNVSSGVGLTDTVLTAMYRIESGTTAQSAGASNGASGVDSSACIATFYPAGFGPGTVTFPYDGVLDEWGLWDRILTDAEAAERYNNGFGSTGGGGGSPLNPPNPPTPTVSIPSGSTANRPIIGGTTGQLYFNTDTDTLEYWDGSAWQPAAPAVADYILESIVDAKGDLLAGTADNTIARVAVGSDGKVLTANSGATPGVSWETPTVYAPANAHYVTSQAESGLSAELVLGTDVIMAGTFASLPSAGIAGRLYFATDAAGGRWYRDNGASWVQTTKGLSEMIGLSLIAAKGDLIAGTGAGAVSNVTVGSDGKVLTADSGASTGVSWQTPSAGAETDPLSIHNSLIDAKGDLLAGTADNTPARVAVGTNGYLLKADSGATPGVSWVDPAGIDTGAIPKSLVDVKGDIIAATADNTVARKAAGTDGTFLRPKAANSDGLEWYDHEGAADPHPGYVLESLYDAKGDILAASADNTPAKLTVGTNNYVLTAASGETTGLKWAPSTGTGGAVDLLAGHTTNEIKAWPPLIANDVDLDAANHWWRKVGTPSTAPTYVDVAGESGITATYRDCIKVVAAAASDGMKQTYTYADEPRLKSGRTVSLALAIWSVSSVSVTAKLVNSDATHTDASAVTAAAWTIVTIEGHVLAGTSCDLQVTAGAAGTFYVVPLGLRVGSFAMSLPPRPTRTIQPDTVTHVKNLGGIGDEATWTDVDCTSTTSNLAFRLWAGTYIFEAVSHFILYVRRNLSSADGDLVGEAFASVQVAVNHVPIILDDGQIFEYYLDRTAGSSTLDAGYISVWAWDEWA